MGDGGGQGGQRPDLSRSTSSGHRKYAAAAAGLVVSACP